MKQNLACRLAIAGWLLLLSSVALAAEPTKESPAVAWATCEIILGKHVEHLGLTDQQGQPVVYEVRRGSSVFLPPGQYTVEEIQLEGGYSARCIPTRPEDRLVLAPDKPVQFTAVGLPLTPTVAVKRSGRLLTLDYSLLDADGRSYRKDDRTDPPQWAVYQGDELLASGSFEYG